MEMKMTKAMMFEMIKAETANEEIKAFCDHELELLASKAEKAKGRTSKHKSENDVLRTAILETLAEIKRPVTVSELLTLCPACVGLTNQRVTGLLTTMGEKGTNEVIRTVEKRVAYYSVESAE